MYYIGVRHGKKGERRQNKSVLFSVPRCTWPLSMCIHNLKTLALIEAKKFVTENLLGEKENWTNKENDKPQHADSLLHNTRSHTQHLYQISKSSAQ